MAAKLVPTIKTVYTNLELIKGFVEGWKKQFDELPKKKSIAVLYAQNAIETGSTSSMWNNNIGNVKYIPSKNPEDDNVQYMMLSNVWEIINGARVVFQPPNPATWFRSFDTLADGLAFHLDFLKNHRYKKAWAAVEAGSPVDFAHLLKMANYYTAPEEDYVRAVALYFNKFMKDNTFEQVIAAMTVSTPEVVTNSDKPDVVETTTISENTVIPEPTTVQPEVLKSNIATSKLSFLENIIAFLSNLFAKKINNIYLNK